MAGVNGSLVCQRSAPKQCWLVAPLECAPAAAKTCAGCPAAGMSQAVPAPAAEPLAGPWSPCPSGYHHSSCAEPCTSPSTALPRAHSTHTSSLSALSRLQRGPTTQGSGFRRDAVARSSALELMLETHPTPAVGPQVAMETAVPGPKLHAAPAWQPEYLLSGPRSC